MRNNRVGLLVVPVVLVLLSSCQWLQQRGDATLSGVQAGETAIGVGNVSSLVERWRSPGSWVHETPTVHENRVHTTTGTWSVDAGPSCSGAPLVCPPASHIPSGFDNMYASATLGFGSAYVLPLPGPTRTLAAFDAAGVVGCGGAPTTCQPEWTYTTAPYETGAPPESLLLQGTGSPTISGSTLYAAGVTSAATPRLYAFDATGVDGCSGAPKVCRPLWATDDGAFPTTPAVSGGSVFVIEDSGESSDAELRVYDADGSVGCSGTPTICEPMWIGDFGAESDEPVGWTSPVVDGVVYAIAGTTMFAFDADGGPACSGSPVVCQPLWTAGVPGVHDELDPRAPAVVDGIVLVPSEQGVYAFDATGSNGCAGAPTVCEPLRRFETGATTEATTATVANGVLYAGTDDGLFAFDLATTSCGGDDLPLCPPLWHGLDGQTVGGPAIVNGRIHVAADGRLVTFGLP